MTFALFAYNQEDFIREAVKGAFAQTYEQMEIILSDDCSSDKTFKIMQEMANNYRGPHVIKTRQSEVNLGTAQHVYAVYKEMDGELLVVAAGDDISCSNRTDLLTEAWICAGKPIATVHSSLMRVNEDLSNGSLNHPITRENISASGYMKKYTKTFRQPFLAPTCAFDKRLFSKFDPIFGGSLIEDSVLRFRCVLIGQFIYIDSPLVTQRVIKNSTGRGHSLLKPRQWSRMIRSRMISYQNSLHDLSCINSDDSIIEAFEDEMLKRIRRLPVFLISERKKLSFYQKVRLFVLNILIFPSSAKLSYRTKRALGSLELTETGPYQYLKKIITAMPWSKNTNNFWNV